MMVGDGDGQMFYSATPLKHHRLDCQWSGCRRQEAGGGGSDVEPADEAVAVICSCADSAKVPAFLLDDFPPCTVTEGSAGNKQGEPKREFLNRRIFVGYW
jgi:hypothetical protein